MFTELAAAIIHALTAFINTFSGFLQVVVYLAIGTLFFYACGKTWQAFRGLKRFDFHQPDSRSRILEQPGHPAPLALHAASFFCQTKKHYLLEKRGDGGGHKTMPPDAFIRDAAFQYSERHFEERYLEPISLIANLMPPLGFIGTIIGMVVHFLSNSGSLNSHLTVTGIATALYTTFVGLVCYILLELLLKILSALGRKRIDEGLAAASEGVWLLQDKKAA